MTRPTAAISALRTVLIKGETGGNALRQACRICIDDGVGQAADPTNQRQGAITQRVELRQAARLKTRGYEDHVGAADDQMRQAVVVADLDTDLPAVTRSCGRKTELEIGIARAEQDELRPACHKLGQGPRGRGRALFVG